MKFKAKKLKNREELQGMGKAKETQAQEPANGEKDDQDQDQHQTERPAKKCKTETKDPPTEEEIRRLKKTHKHKVLQTMCVSSGLPSGGNKTDLAKRLVSHAAFEAIVGDCLEPMPPEVASP